MKTIIFSLMFMFAVVSMANYHPEIQNVSGDELTYQSSFPASAAFDNQLEQASCILFEEYLIIENNRSLNWSFGSMNNFISRNEVISRKDNLIGKSLISLTSRKFQVMEVNSSLEWG